MLPFLLICFKILNSINFFCKFPNQKILFQIQNLKKIVSSALKARFWLIIGNVSSYVVLFVFCFSTGKAILAINKGLQRSVFFSLLCSTFFAFALPILCCLICIPWSVLHTEFRNPFHSLSHSHFSLLSPTLSTIHLSLVLVPNIREN